jgi:hypothetical protein
MFVLGFQKQLLFLFIDLLLWISLWNISDYIFEILNITKHIKVIINIIIASICILLISLIPR